MAGCNVQMWSRVTVDLTPIAASSMVRRRKHAPFVSNIKQHEVCDRRVIGHFTAFCAPDPANRHARTQAHAHTTPVRTKQKQASIFLLSFPRLSIFLRVLMLRSPQFRFLHVVLRVFVLFLSSRVRLGRHCSRGTNRPICSFLFFLAREVLCPVLSLY